MRHVGEMFYVSSNTHVMCIMQLDVSVNKHKLGCQGTADKVTQHKLHP